MVPEPPRPRDESAPLRQLTPWLLLALALSVSAMVLGAGRGDRLVTALGAGALAIVVLATAVAINTPLWSADPEADGRPSAVKSTIEANIWLAAFTYAWGASALFAIYTLSELSWRHAWQYGAGAALAALGLVLLAQSLRRRTTVSLPPLFLTGLHGLAATSWLVYLVGSGKLATLKGDWAANDVFLAGGLAIVAVCIVSAITQTRASG
jgi:hypothetical protein